MREGRGIFLSKKGFCMALAAALMLSMLSGCGKAEDPSGKVADGGDNGDD